MDSFTPLPKRLENTYQTKENTTKTTTKTNELSVEAITKDTIISNQKPPSYIRKKLLYNKFVKLVKKGGYTSSRLIAKSLGVHKDTIMEWSNTSKVKEALSEDVASYVKNIKVNRDWKAQAYLLDKITEDDDKTEQVINLTNLIQVNTIESNKNNKGDTTL